MRELLQNALSGAGSYFQSNHMVVLAMGILVYCFVVKPDTNPREKRLLRLSVVMLALLLFPVSALVLMLYQTRFYSYEWIWSLMPVTLLISWGSVIVLWRQTGQSRQDGGAGRRLAAGVAVLLVLLLITGNLGIVQAVGEEERTQGSRSRQVVQYVRELPGAEEAVLWGPRAVLEAARQQGGEIKVLYGRNMWDPAAAAHTYDIYPMEQQRLFDWVEMLEHGDAGEFSLQLTIFLEDRMAGPLSDQSRADAFFLQLAAEYGADLWVFPAEASERITRACEQLTKEYGLRAQAAGEVAGYTIWLCE
ncbi:MAG: hypothetical protein NC543_04685 [bacterium]|nr:hypothetical protein [bacterium]MCM1374835.1 hypothetical protein [Muribaculum sp.]